MRRLCRRNNLHARTALCGDCTNGGFAFASSPFPQLLANMLFALVQLLYRGKVCRKIARISIADTVRRWCWRNNLQVRTALCGDCANGGFAFSASPFPQLLANMYFALVQLLFRGMACREFARISIDGIIRRWCWRTNLPARTALCVDCTNGGFAISASPFPQLFAHM